MEKENNKNLVFEEKIAPSTAGMPVLIINIALLLVSVLLIIWSAIALESSFGLNLIYLMVLILSSLFLCIGCPLLFAGLKVIKPKEALVLTFFGKYFGTLKIPGFYFVNPFAIAFSPAVDTNTPDSPVLDKIVSATAKSTEKTTSINFELGKKKISLKAMTLNNEKQKINDQLGNPIIIGIVVIWRVVNTAKAVFNVDNYSRYLSIQCDSALRNIVRLYPYDIIGDETDNEKSLRGSSLEIAEKLKEEIQSKVEIAGLVVDEARITHLAYAPEIAAAMLQRQQAAAIIAARQMIVDGAVGIVEMALSKLYEKGVVELDEERKAAMVSNLLVVLCGNKDPQPIVNSGTLY